MSSAVVVIGALRVNLQTTANMFILAFLQLPNMALRIFISMIAQFTTLHLHTKTISQFANYGQLKGGLIYLLISY